ncbi:hypothetical protein GCM10010174_85140 [Kutzneria viridogrisea]
MPDLGFRVSQRTRAPLGLLLGQTDLAPHLLDARHLPLVPLDNSGARFNIELSTFALPSGKEDRLIEGYFRAEGCSCSGGA